jgi:hypothetical protein
MVRNVARGDAARSRRWRRRPNLETLESRVVLSTTPALPNIAVFSVTEINANTVSVSYEVQTVAAPKSFTIAIDRSSSNAINATSTQVGASSVTGLGLTVGTHTANVNIPGALLIDPSQPFVVAVANPTHAFTESTYADNSLSYRITTIAAVTSGFTFPQPSWVKNMASALSSDGFDYAFSFDWAADSIAPVSGLPAVDGQKLANQIDSFAMTLPHGTVIDLQLIAHSRGSVVIDQAIWDLVAMEQSGKHPELSGLAAGYTKMTFLDPHPAQNTMANGSPANFFSASTGAFGQMGALTLKAMQNIMNDPNITIPAGVNDVEVFYQHTNVPSAATLFSQFFNIWGEVPIPGATHYYDVTALPGGNGHRQVPTWYLSNVVPLLKNAITTIPGLVATSMPNAPTPPPATGASYEVSLISQYTSSLTVAQNLENLMANVYSDFSTGHPVWGAIDLQLFEGYVVKQGLQGNIQLPAVSTFAQMYAMISDYIAGKVIQTTGDLF